jgi:hypothetical protein
MNIEFTYVDHKAPSKPTWCLKWLAEILVTVTGDGEIVAPCFIIFHIRINGVSALSFDVN